MVNGAVTRNDRPFGTTVHRSAPVAAAKTERQPNPCIFPAARPSLPLAFERCRRKLRDTAGWPRYRWPLNNGVEVEVVERLAFSGLYGKTARLLRNAR